MIELATDVPATVIIATAHGKVTDDDYERVLIPAVAKAAAEGGKLRMLYVLGDEFEGYDAEAAMDDTKLGLKHWRDFERIGVVTDRDGYRAMVKGFGFLLPGEVRVFHVADLAIAREWITSV